MAVRMERTSNKGIKGLPSSQLLQTLFNGCKMAFVSRILTHCESTVVVE